LKTGDASIADDESGRFRQELERLLAARADINATDNAGLVPLHIAAGEGASEAARFLCENGADVNVQTNYEELTALHRVVEEGHNECLEVLVAAGADLNARYLTSESTESTLVFQSFGLLTRSHACANFCSTAGRRRDLLRSMKHRGTDMCLQRSSSSRAMVNETSLVLFAHRSCPGIAPSFVSLSCTAKMRWIVY